MSERILLVEDEEKLARMIELELNYEGYEVEKALDGRRGLELALTGGFDLILLDLMLPGITGEELVSVFSEKTPVIVLSAKSGLDSKVDVLSAGAEDYICKPFDLPELLVRIQVQLRRQNRAGGREAVHAQEGYVWREWRLDPDTQEMTACGKTVALTRHEFLIVELLIRNPRRVFTKEMIYEYAWGEEYLAEDKTINVHISNIRSKLKESGTDSYIQTVWGMGFKLS